MKNQKALLVVALMLTASALFSSCMHRDDYNTQPNYNNHNPTPTPSATSFDEEFNGSDLYGWTFASVSDSAYANITNGSYQYVDYSAARSNMTLISTGLNTTGNFTAQTRVKSNKTMGLIFGASSTDNGYALFIDTAGNYALYREGTGTVASTPIIPFTQDTLYAVKNDWNTLEIDQTNGVWNGYINGTRIFTMAARSIYGSNFGFKVLPGTVGYADYLIINTN